MSREEYSTHEKAARMTEHYRRIEAQFGKEAAELARLIMASFAKNPPKMYPTVDALVHHIEDGHLRFDKQKKLFGHRPATFLYRVPGEKKDRRLTFDPDDSNATDEYVRALIALVRTAHELYGSPQSQTMPETQILSALGGVIVAVRDRLDLL